MKVFHESYGELTRSQLAAYKKFNVSPHDHDQLVMRFGDNADAIIEHVRENSVRGYYQPDWPFM